MTPQDIGANRHAVNANNELNADPQCGMQR